MKIQFIFKIFEIIIKICPQRILLKSLLISRQRLKTYKSMKIKTTKDLDTPKRPLNAFFKIMRDYRKAKEMLLKYKIQRIVFYNLFRNLFNYIFSNIRYKFVKIKK